MARLERAASTSQMWRPTNWATPGYLVVMIIARNSCDSKFFLSVVIYVVKAGFWPGLAVRENPANVRAARGSGLWLRLSWMKTPTLPKQARYQLRYTRLFSYLYGWAVTPKPLGEKGYSGNRDRKFLIFLRKSLGRKIAENSGKH